jgi:hypothetical protein
MERLEERFLVQKALLTRLPVLMFRPPRGGGSRASALLMGG